MKTCLIFGGNGFVGFEALSRIIDNHEIDIILANRGRSWDWDKKSKLEMKLKYFSDSPIKLSHFKVDRKKSFSDSDAGDFMQYIAKLNCIDFVIDFSAYAKSAVEEVLRCFGKKICRYIYISTDSVYEVCEKKLHDAASVETDAVRPKCIEKLKKFDKKDRYGKKKLDCEEVLNEYSCKIEDFSYTILRLADVVGFRDSTNRWLEYLLWVKVACELNIPLYLPEEIEHRPISLVYSNDIGDLITRLLLDDFKCFSKNEAFNLAFTETVDVKEMLHCMCSALSCKSKLRTEFSTDAPLFYPSVERGPIDCTKARSLLLWKPRPFNEACQEIVKEYEECLCSERCSSDMWDAAQELLTDVEQLYDKETIVQIEKLLKHITHQ